MISLSLCSFAGLIAGFVIGIIYKERRIEVVEYIEVPPSDTNIEDVIRLANTNNMADMNGLLLKHKVSTNLPVFYEKFMHLNKQNREVYYGVLIDILSKGKREYMSKLRERSPVLATSDLLLLLMCEMELDNKTMARIMGTNIETLKKRKTRLKAKITQTDSDSDSDSDLDSDFEEYDQLPEQPVQE